jgi:hypothetical protein
LSTCGRGAGCRSNNSETIAFIIGHQHAILLHKALLLPSVASAGQLYQTSNCLQVENILLMNCYCLAPEQSRYLISKLSRHPLMQRCCFDLPQPSFNEMEPPMLPTPAWAQLRLAAAPSLVPFVMSKRHLRQIQKTY